MDNPIAWFEIYVDDLDRARKFYESVFQTTLQPLAGSGEAGAPHMLGFPMSSQHYGAGGALVHMQGMHAGGNSTLVYFACQDCAVEEARVAGAGGRVQRPKWPIGQHGFIALVMDTEGNMLGLHSMH